MNWYKIAKNQLKKMEEWDKILETSPKSLFKNPYFLAGSKKDYEKLKHLEGEELREAQKLYELGWYWKKKELDPYFFNRVKREHRNKMKDDSKRKKHVDDLDRDRTVKTLYERYRNPSRGGWWDEDQYSQEQPRQPSYIDEEGMKRFYPVDVNRPFSEW